MATVNKRLPTATHWGAYHAEIDGGRVIAMHPIAQDADPSPIGQSIPGALDGPLRIRQPMVRAGWLERRHRRDAATGAAPSRSCRCSWDAALDLVADELEARVAGSTAMRRSSAAPTAGPAPGASTTRRASSTAS